MGLIKARQLRQTPRWRRSFLEIRDDASDSVRCQIVLNKYWLVCNTGFKGCCQSPSCEACEKSGSIDLSSGTTAESKATTVISTTSSTISTTDPPTFSFFVQTTNPRTTTTSPSKTSDSAGGATTDTVTSVHTVDGVPITSTYFHTVTATADADTSNPPSSSSSTVALPVGIAVAVVFVSALLIAFFLLRRKRKNKQLQTVGLLSGEAQAISPPGSPIPKEGFFRGLKNRFSAVIGSPPPPAYVENDKDPVSPGMVELLGDVEHTPELPSGDGGTTMAPTELPSSLSEGSHVINAERNNVGLGVGLRDGERGIQELGSSDAPAPPPSRKEDLSGNIMTTTRQCEEFDPREIPSEGVGVSRGTSALSQEHTGHVLSFMQYEGGTEGERSEGATLG